MLCVDTSHLWMRAKKKQASNLHIMVCKSALSCWSTTVVVCAVGGMSGVCIKNFKTGIEVLLRLLSQNPAVGCRTKSVVVTRYRGRQMKK